MREMQKTIAYIDAHRDRFVRELMDWVRIPSISDLPEHAGDVARSAEFLRSELARWRPDATRVLPTGGHPAVYGEWGHDPAKPTLLVYGHHDVQPVDPLDAWLSPPFQPAIREGRLYGRGTVDDKGQVFLHAKAIESIVETHAGGLPINLRLLVEGEEEVGSQHLGDLLREHAAALEADCICISDTAMYGRGIPSLCVGLRGLAYFDLVVHGPSNDVHSGSFGGGIANPANALARILASFHDDQGRIAVPGFYDRVRELRPAERRQIADLEHDDAAWLRSSGAPLAVGEQGHSTLERIWTRPALDVCGIKSGFQGGGSKTIIPAVASAKISCRLVPDQIPEDVAQLLAAHVANVTPPGVKAELAFLSGGAPYVAEIEHPVYELAQQAFVNAFGRRAVYMREGGTIPFVRTIAESTGKPCLLMGFGQPDENSHAPNEWLDLDNFLLGIKSAAYLYEALSQLR
jgi:acetylornithine deacetylase/succinyl-diaminopimelate desuccinylase-like protein